MAGIVLNYPATQNPTTIAAGIPVVNIGTAVFGTAIAQWTVTNLGTVEGNGASGVGVDLAAGGLVVNGGGGVITGGSVGVATGGIAGSVVNYGVVTGGNYGVSLPGPTSALVNFGMLTGGVAVATVTNSGAIDSTAYGIRVEALTNSGAIAVSSGSYPSFFSARTLSNSGSIATSDNISGTSLVNSGMIYAGLVSFATAANYGLIASSGVLVQGVGGANLNNYGTIEATLYTAVSVSPGGALVNGGYGLIAGTQTGVVMNASSGAAYPAVVNYGTIMGYVGISAPGAGAVVTNAGTVIGYGGTALSFASSADLLVVDPGAVFVGVVAGYGSTLELAAGYNPGTLSWLGVSFTNFGAVSIDPGAAWVFRAVAPSAYIGIYIGSYASAEFRGPVGSGVGVVFTAAYETLKLDRPRQFAGAVFGFQPGDTIDLARVRATGYSYSYGVLSLTNAGTPVTQLHVSTTYPGASAFALSRDGAGGTDITLVLKG